MTFAYDPDMTMKLVLALVLGAAIGLEREFNKSAAGIKTYSIVCVGSALFTMAALKVNISVASGVITGIGFLGAATVFKTTDRVVGLTTAALIWATAAIGFAIGIGEHYTAILSTLIVLFILIPMEHFEKKILKWHKD